MVKLWLILPHLEGVLKMDISLFLSVLPNHHLYLQSVRTIISLLNPLCHVHISIYILLMKVYEDLPGSQTIILSPLLHPPSDSHILEKNGLPNFALKLGLH